MHEIRQIRRGGFGVVHEVEVKGERLARKTFQAPAPNAVELEKMRKRFAREVRVQSKLKHPNIMPIIDSDLSAANSWFTMPLASESFEEKIGRDAPSGQVDIAAWQDVLAGVEELHRLGYVHRDLKPANILWVHDKWVLADFGLILPVARDTTVLTGSRSAYGTHEYAAPEQARDFRTTPEQADIFALGCILHDLVEPGGYRVPFAQIRSSGPYGPILEKCTELEPRKRFPNIQSLRSALFDILRTAQFAAPISDDAELLKAVLEDPASIDAWRRFIGHMEGLQSQDRHTLLRSINAEVLVQLKVVDDILFGRLMSLICEWVESTGFDWAYCDVIGDRLVQAYGVSPVRIQCQIVLCMLELAVSHNRWHVMNQAGSLLGQAADNGLIDRFLIEAGLESRIRHKLIRIEEVVSWPRTRWHSKIAMHLTQPDEDEPTE